MAPQQRAGDVAHESERLEKEDGCVTHCPSCDERQTNDREPDSCQSHTA